MKILVLTSGSYEDYQIDELLVHSSDQEWTVNSLDAEYEARCGFVAPVYQIADNPTPQQLADGQRTQAALRSHALAKHKFEIGFYKWLTKERGFKVVKWEESWS